MKAVLTFILVASTQLIFSQDNLLDGKNPNCDGDYPYTYGSSTHYITSDTHTNDGSGCFVFTGQGSDFLNNSLKTATVSLTKGKKYLMRAYMKMTNAQYGQNILLKVSKSDGSNPVEMHWNNFENDDWEEVILPYRAPEDGEYNFTIFAWPKYMHTTDGEFGASDGSNLEDCPYVLLDDFSIIEYKEEIISSEPTTPKIGFNSEYIKVDSEGNFTVNENGEWKPIFPRIAYQSWYGDFAAESARMAEYGFTGWANLESVDKFKQSVANGMIYNGIQVNDLEGNKNTILAVRDAINNGELPQTSFLLYVIDNEMEDLCRYENTLAYGPWLDANDTDPTTNKRARPVLVFNGQAEGIARSYKNNNNDLMDITGTYISCSGEESDFRYNPTSNISLLRNSDRQQAPVVFLDVQSYYHYAFIPSIFKGILNGAKGLKFWRGGTDYKGSALDFRDNVWAPALKGPDGVFARIDSMLVPIISQPMGTTWEADIKDSDRDIIAIGTRDNKELDKHYVILSNFADTDTTIEITFTGINVSNVIDFFTKQDIGTINNNILSVKAGHFNEGYLVMEINGDVTASVKKNSQSDLRIYPNPTKDFIIVENKNELIKKIDIVDMSGKTIKSITGIMQNNITINTSAFIQGIYFIKTLTYNNNIHINKILVQ